MVAEATTIPSEVRRDVELERSGLFPAVFRAHALFADSDMRVDRILAELGVEFEAVKHELAALGHDDLQYTRYIPMDDSAEVQKAIDAQPLMLAIHEATMKIPLDPRSPAGYLMSRLEPQRLAHPDCPDIDELPHHPWARFAEETSTTYLDAHDVERDPRPPPLDARPGGAHRLWSEPMAIVEAAGFLVSLSPSKVAWLVAALNRANPSLAGAKREAIEDALRRNDDVLGRWPATLGAYLRRVLADLAKRQALWTRGQSTRMLFINPIVDECASADVRILLALASTRREQARRFDALAPRCCQHDRIDRRIALDEFIVPARAGLTQTELVQRLGLGGPTIADAEARLRDAGALEGSGRSSRTLTIRLQPLVLQAIVDGDGKIPASAARLDDLIRAQYPEFAARVPLNDVGRMFLIRRFLPWLLAYWDDEACRMRLTSRGLALLGRCGTCGKPWGHSQLAWQVDPFFGEMHSKSLPTHARCVPTDSNATTTPPVCHGCLRHLWSRPALLGDSWRQSPPRPVAAMMEAWQGARADATAAGRAGQERWNLLTTAQTDLFGIDTASSSELDLVERAARAFHEAVFQGRTQLPRGAPSIARWVDFATSWAQELHEIQAPAGPASLMLTNSGGWAYHLDCPPRAP